MNCPGVSAGTTAADDPFEFWTSHRARRRDSQLVTTLSYRAPATGRRKKGSGHEGAPDLREIRIGDQNGMRPLAYVETDPALGGSADGANSLPKHARSLAIWEDPHRSRRLAVVTTNAAGSRQSTEYEVWGPSGEALGTVRLDKASMFRPRRTRWNLRPAVGPSIEGAKGRLFWWWVWWSLSPLWLLIIVGSLLSASGDIARMPRSVEWRLNGEKVLSFDASAENYRLFVPWLDLRLVTAMIALHQSHPGILA